MEVAWTKHKTNEDTLQTVETEREKVDRRDMTYYSE